LFGVVVNVAGITSTQPPLASVGQLYGAVAIAVVIVMVPATLLTL
jgi:hypothetical protein